MMQIILHDMSILMLLSCFMIYSRMSKGKKSKASVEPGVNWDEGLVEETISDVSIIMLSSFCYNYCTLCV